MVNPQAITRLRKLLPKAEVDNIIQLAHAQDAIEREGVFELNLTWEEMIDQSLEDLSKTGAIDTDAIYDQVLKFLAGHTLDVMEAGMSSAQREVGRSSKRRLAAPPRPKLPRSMSDLMRMWDLWRTRRNIPKRQKALANKIKTLFIEKVREVWKESSHAYRTGDEATKVTIRKEIQKATKVPYARAKMIVETETTTYYNQTRREIYDASPDVTHYLFVAIRDSATTKWCKTRDGIVYRKGDRVTDLETPACHWNCRSEMIPLTPLNPAHLKLIKTYGLQRENRSPAPLPPAWRRAA